MLPNTGGSGMVFSRPQTSDAALFGHNDHVSYFLVTGTTDEEPDRILGGDRNLTLNGTPARGRIAPSTNDIFGFTSPGHHSGAGNLLFSDGSFQQVSISKAARTFSDGLSQRGTSPPSILLIP